MDMNNMGGGSDSNTGTRDVTYDLTAVLYHALQGAENCQTYMSDAQGKQEHRQFFQQALESQRQIAEQAKQLLHDALMQETGGGSMGQQGMGGQSQGDDSAFRFASSETPGGSDQFSQQNSREPSMSGGGSSNM